MALIYETWHRYIKHGMQHIKLGGSYMHCLHWPHKFLQTQLHNDVYCLYMKRHVEQLSSFLDIFFLSLPTIFNPRTWYLNPTTPNPRIFLATPRTEHFFFQIDENFPHSPACMIFTACTTSVRSFLKASHQAFWG
mgnify:CR=1 FL=1